MLFTPWTVYVGLIVGFVGFAGSQPHHLGKIDKVDVDHATKLLHAYGDTKPDSKVFDFGIVNKLDQKTKKFKTEALTGNKDMLVWALGIFDWHLLGSYTAPHS